MKFSVSSAELQRTLSKLGGVIPTRSTMPILENILFDLTGNQLTVTATDLAIALTVGLKVHGVEDGKIAVPAKRIMDTMRSLPDTGASFTIDVGTNRIRIMTDNGEYMLTGENAKEYPQTPVMQGAEVVKFGTDLLKTLIHRTAFAVSGDELRPAMMGVLLQAKGNSLQAVSTDGHRLVRVTYSSTDVTGLQKDIIIPAKALHVLARSLEGAATELTVSATHARFAFNGSTLVTRLIDETYPNYESVIPSENDKELTVSRDNLIASIRRVALYASATTHQVRLSAVGEKLEISAQDLDSGGEAKESIACGYKGEPLEIGFNSLYLTDILTHLEAEQVVFKFSAPTRAAIIAPAEPVKGEDVLMLVMPVRLNT